jgi:hypothetical protein
MQCCPASNGGQGGHLHGTTRASIPTARKVHSGQAAPHEREADVSQINQTQGSGNTADRSERRLTTPDDNSWDRRNRAGPQPCILTDFADPPEATTRFQAASGRRCTSWTRPTSGSRCSGSRPGRSRPSGRAAAAASPSRPAPGAASGTSGTARTGGPATGRRRPQTSPRSDPDLIPGARLASPEAGSDTAGDLQATAPWPNLPQRCRDTTHRHQR